MHNGSSWLCGATHNLLEAILLRRNREESISSSLGDVSPTVEESVRRTGLADPTPSDAFPGCAARRVARMVHFSNPVSPSRLTPFAR
jgi:hypothetical protein